MKGLTKRQREIVDFIQEFITSNRYSPSYREICRHFGFTSLGSVYKHVNALKRKGAILNLNQSSRSITLTEQSKQIEMPKETEVPFIGHITAGLPIQTFSQNQNISVPSTLVPAPGKTYALRVQGDSLNEEMIADGDLLLVEARQEAHPGETVVALINGHTTIVKRYYPREGYIHLTGSNPLHHPMILRLEDILIQGIVVGLIRLFG